MSTQYLKNKNESTGMAWQLAIPQSYKKPGVYCEKSYEKTGLHYKNEADSLRHTHMVSRQ